MIYQTRKFADKILLKIIPWKVWGWTMTSRLMHLRSQIDPDIWNKKWVPDPAQFLVSSDNCIYRIYDLRRGQ